MSVQRMIFCLFFALRGRDKHTQLVIVLEIGGTFLFNIIIHAYLIMSMSTITCVIVSLQ